MDDDKSEPTRLPALTWKHRRLLRERIRARYEHVSKSTWNKHLRGIIYIPAAAEQHIPPPKRSSEAAFVAELQRLAALNVPWASAILGYRALLLKPDGSRDIDAAVSHCHQAAQGGDPYAQYMLSWALLLKGDANGAAVNMKKAARQLFPPAVLDIVSFRSSEWDRARLKGERALRLQLSDRVGHACTLARRLMYYRSGESGVLNLLLGYALMPFAIARYMIPAALFPFSADVFLFSPKLSVNALRFGDR